MKQAMLAFALLLMGCAGPAPQTYTGKDALYQELGRSEGITKVVDLFFQRINSDARINTLFAKVDHNDLRRLVIEQICAASGGPCTYTGRSMEEAHSGLNLTNKDFESLPWMRRKSRKRRRRSCWRFSGRCGRKSSVSDS
jgi:hemoglobin